MNIQIIKQPGIWPTVNAGDKTPLAKVFHLPLIEEDEGGYAISLIGLLSRRSAHQQAIERESFLNLELLTFCGRIYDYLL